MEKPPTIDQLREEVRRAIRETGVRALARELKMSPTALTNFANTPGSTVYAKSYGKLLPWYELRASMGLTAPNADSVRPAVRILTRGMTPEEERRARAEIARWIRRAFAGRQGVDEAVDAALDE
jgi:RimJ/RimL family protein N-acetyltransferase